jgi:flagellar biosynthesis/type III secretory pathway protein FliH
MATIIKPNAVEHASGAAFRGVAYDLTDMAAQAEGYLGDVRRRAAEIVEQARREAAAIRQDAEAAGRRAAEQAIERILDEKVARQMKTLTPALQAAVKQVEESRQDWLQRWESAAIELAAAIAGRLVRGELGRRPEISKAWVREALELAAGSGEVTIRLNPADHQTLHKQLPQLASAFAPLATVKAATDDLISPGGCQLVTEFGVVDMQLEAQLERIKEELA